MSLRGSGELTNRYSLTFCYFSKFERTTTITEEARWPSGRSSDRSERPGDEPHSGRRGVSLSEIHLPPKSTGNTQEAAAPSRHD